MIKKSPQVSREQKKPHQVIVNSPDDALAEFKNGNDRFMKDKSINTNYKEQIEHTKSDQHPHSVILSCLAPVFHQKLYSTRVSVIFLLPVLQAMLKIQIF